LPDDGPRVGLNRLLDVLRAELLWGVLCDRDLVGGPTRRPGYYGLLGEIRYAGANRPDDPGRRLVIFGDLIQRVEHVGLNRLLALLCHHDLSLCQGWMRVSL
jgi:hypothetical protein